MKKVLMVMMMVAMACGIATGAEVSAGVDFASAYVFRGVTFNDGLVAQPGLEASGLPVTLGVWGNLDVDDYDDALEGGQLSEIDLYASYDLPLELDLISFSVGYTEYTYPSGGGDADREISLSASLETLLAPSLALYYGIDGGIEETLYVELGIGHEFEVSDDVSIELGAAVGYLEPEDGESGFSHANVSAGVSYGLFSASVTYVGQLDDEVLADMSIDAETGEMSAGYDVEVVGTIGIAKDF